MLCREVVAGLLLCSLVAVNGMPQNTNNGQDSANLPFIQFTNGGLRFNFAGYHAEAGLGGLLGGSRAGGGLHASAGTPWGAQAAAGLGGLLGGDNANAGGGLYARAGLGNGRPEAAAGLGGMLDGSGRSSSPILGGLFARATTGSGAPSGNAEQGEANNKDNEGRKDGKDGGRRGGSNANIQIIAKKPTKAKQVSSVAEATAVAAKPTDPPAAKEVREIQPTQSVFGLNAAGIADSTSGNHVPQPAVGLAVEKVKIIGAGVEQVPVVPPLINDDNAIVRENHPVRVRTPHPKWAVRKRFWGPRKQYIYESSVEAQDASGSQIQKRQAPSYDNNVAASENRRPIQSNDNNGYYDDIFKIPVATLTAVNQLLNNNSG